MFYLFNLNIFIYVISYAKNAVINQFVAIVQPQIVYPICTPCQNKSEFDTSYNILNFLQNFCTILMENPLNISLFFVKKVL